MRKDFDKHMLWPLGLVVGVCPVWNCKVTFQIGSRTYDRPIQRLYELEVCDSGQSTNRLLQLPKSDDKAVTKREITKAGLNDAWKRL